MYSDHCPALTKPIKGSIDTMTMIISRVQPSSACRRILSPPCCTANTRGSNISPEKAATTVELTLSAHWGWPANSSTKVVAHPAMLKSTSRSPQRGSSKQPRKYRWNKMPVIEFTSTIQLVKVSPPALCGNR